MPGEIVKPEKIAAFIQPLSKLFCLHMYDGIIVVYVIIRRMPFDHIIIIGGGAAGLMAASKLSAQYKVTILEAQDVLGGRIKTVELPGIYSVI